MIAIERSDNEEGVFKLTVDDKQYRMNLGRCLIDTALEIMLRLVGEGALKPLPGLRLCYVRRGTAYFTPRRLREQWGDDWDDAPYEHNAGEPYGPGIVKVVFDTKFWMEPCFDSANSLWSVQDINRKECPWLRHKQTGATIFSGTTIETFKLLTRASEVSDEGRCSA